MAKKKEAIDRIGFWSLQKLDILGKYLPAYSRIMCRQNWCPAFYYVDAFTGTITPQDKETLEYLAGSPIRALETEPPFAKYYFIEKDAERFQNAKNLEQKYPNRNVIALHGDCNDKLCNLILPELSANKYRRALVFLDPYGLSVNWNTIQELSKTKQCDVLINFPVMGVKRNLPREQLPEPEALRCICNIFGDQEWYKGLYTSQSVPTLMQGTVTEWVRSGNIEEKLVNDYIVRLKGCFNCVTPPKLMANSKSAILYALILASHNDTAIKIMNEIFKKAEQEPKRRLGNSARGQGTLL